jgi:hypothetical protein
MPPNDQNYPFKTFALPSPEGINSGTVYKLGTFSHKPPHGINCRPAQRLVRIRLRHPRR